MRPTEAVATRPPHSRRGRSGPFRHPWRTTLTLIGAGIGAALTCLAHPGCGSAPVAVTTHVIFDHGAVGLLLLGAGVGALVDARWHRTLYDVPFGTAQLSIDPIVSRERAGAGLTLKW